MMRIRSIWLLALGFVLWTTACSTSKKSAQTTNAEKEYKPYANALLWEVSGSELENPSYVFGTVHLIDKEKFFLPDQLLASLDQSKEIVFEVDIDEMSDIGAQMSLLTKAYMNDGKTLSDLLTKEEYAEVEAFFKELGLPLMFFERMKPLFLSVLASMDGDMADMQQSMTSYEFELMDLARARKIPSGGLETLDFQIGLFDSIPYESQAQMLLKGIRNKDDGQGGFDDMMEMYTSQNINAMLGSLEDEDLGEFEHLLLSKRNNAWIPIMKDKMGKQTTFFAVGAGHLAGEEGVLWLLEKQGYKLKPLSIADGTD